MYYFSCEPLVVTMIRAQLWPSAPKRPHQAFTFELLDWAEALLVHLIYAWSIYFDVPSHLDNKNSNIYTL